MATNIILSLADPLATLELAGGKGASLSRLVRAGLPVPEGFIITTQAYRLFVDQNGQQARLQRELEGLEQSQPALLEEASQRIRNAFVAAPIPEELAASIVSAYTEHAASAAPAALAASSGPEPAVAVRSSATAEDLPEASFAGQQDTYLNIRGAQAVLTAVRMCWASLWTGRAISYRLRQGIAPDQVSLAVVVQRLVEAESAGILFTADPVSGRRDRVLVNAAWGLGEAVVGGQVTPDTFTLDKVSGQVLERQIADKQVMTVRVEGGTLEQPAPESQRLAPSLDDAALVELARLGVQIEDLFGLPVDIEWARQVGQGGKRSFAILQARPVTALQPAIPHITVSSEFVLPNPKGQYMRGSLIDFMPDPLTPLFGSMVVPSVNTSLHDLVPFLVGKQVEIYSDYMVIINGFPYISIRFTARQWLNMIFYMVPKMAGLARDSVKLWREKALPRYQQTVRSWKERQAARLTDNEILVGVQELFRAVTDYATMLMVATLGVTAGSEAIFTALYDKLLKRKGDPAAPVFLLGFDCQPIQAERALFDLGQWCQGQESLAGCLKSRTSTELAGCYQNRQIPAGAASEEWAEFCLRLDSYLEQYGYSIYDLDFSRPLPMELPAPMFETLKHFLSGQAKNPYQRQQEMTDSRQSASQALLNRSRGLKRWAFRKSVGWAQSNLPVREDSIAEIGLAYPLIRKLLSELGARLVKAGMLAEAQDVYWLEVGELETAVSTLENGARPSASQELVQQRRAEWQARRKIRPPTVLPLKSRWAGMELETWAGDHSGSADETVIHGLGASPGVVTAPVRVLHGPEDFDQMRPGEVLVAHLTTPAWTPLFAMAAAVVTDIGGPLSHGSIVAREYGIPAVLGCGSATLRLSSGQVVTVDGTSGIVKM